jgi:hypothetical protein
MTEQTLSDTNGNGDRDEVGRFRPGHSQPGPGNPHCRRMKQMRDRLVAALDAECTPGQLKAIIAAMVKKAIGGDVQAARLLLDKIAPVAVELDEDGEIHCILLRRAPVSAGEIGDASAREQRGV